MRATRTAGGRSPAGAGRSAVSVMAPARSWEFSSLSTRSRSVTVTSPTLGQEANSSMVTRKRWFQRVMSLRRSTVMVRAAKGSMPSGSQGRGSRGRSWSSVSCGNRLMSGVDGCRIASAIASRMKTAVCGVRGPAVRSGSAFGSAGASMG